MPDVEGSADADIIAKPVSAHSGASCAGGLLVVVPGPPAISVAVELPPLEGAVVLAVTPSSEADALEVVAPVTVVVEFPVAMVVFEVEEFPINHGSGVTVTSPFRTPS